MPRTTRVPPPKDPRTAICRLLMLESAQAREPDATYLAKVVESKLGNLKLMDVVLKGTPEDIRARMLAGYLRQAAVYERLDWQTRRVARDACEFLGLWDLHAAIGL